jgi:hypothetical protein
MDKTDKKRAPGEDNVGVRLSLSYHIQIRLEESLTGLVCGSPLYDDFSFLGFVKHLAGNAVFILIVVNQ